MEKEFIEEIIEALKGYENNIPDSLKFIDLKKVLKNENTK